MAIGLWVACGTGTPEVRDGLTTGRSITVSATANVLIVEQASSQLNWVQVIPNNIILLAGETTKLSSAAYDQQGRVLQEVQFRWRLNDQEAGSITPGGVFVAGFNTGTFDNSVVVVATPPAGSIGGVMEGRASVTIIEPRESSLPASIRPIPDQVALPPGASIQLFAFALDVSRAVIPDIDLQWRLNQPAMGFISQNGLLTASDVIGTFPDAVQVTLLDRDGTEQAGISATVDVTILDPEDRTGEISTVVLPQVISLRPGQETRFNVLVLDERGSQLIPDTTTWEILDSGAGFLTDGGRFQAAETPGIYRDAVGASHLIRRPGGDISLSTTATVVVLEIPEITVSVPGTLRRIAIFPKRVTLSPDESTRLSVVSLDGDGRHLPDVQVKWFLDPALGEFSPSGNIVAANVPGVHEDAIRVDVSQQIGTEQVSQTINATLIIRGELTKVEITPQTAAVTPGGRIAFRSAGFDANDVLLPDVVYRWSVTREDVGTVDANGVFTAGKDLGEYPGAVQVEIVQRLPVLASEEASPYHLFGVLDSFRLRRLQDDDPRPEGTLAFPSAVLERSPSTR